jgi:hypothetical protein
MVLAEQHDEWQVGRRYLALETLAGLKTSAEILQIPENPLVKEEAA